MKPAEFVGDGLSGRARAAELVRPGLAHGGEARRGEELDACQLESCWVPPDVLTAQQTTALDVSEPGFAFATELELSTAGSDATRP